MIPENFGFILIEANLFDIFRRANHHKSANTDLIEIPGSWIEDGRRNISA